MHLVYNTLAVVVLNDIGEGVILVHAMICSLIAFYIVSGLCRVILILLVITVELFEFINNTLKALLDYIFPNNCRVNFRCQTGVLCEYVAQHPVVKSPLQHAEV